MNADAPAVIVGAGPAGLAAASRLPQGTILLESGPPLESRTEQLNPACGVGGAGLYSDGKFSFKPAGTHVWRLRGDLLAAAEASLAKDLEVLGLTPPTRRNTRVQLDGIDFKEYPSVYAPVEARHRLISSLANSANGTIYTGSKVQKITRAGSTWHIEIEDSGTLRTPRLLLAGGRFGSLLIDRESAPQRCIRLETGIRIEQPRERFFLKAVEGADPKLLINGPHGVSWRTFCCCRGGEVVGIPTPYGWAASGRADGAETDRSNVGFMLRLESPALIRSVAREFPRPRTEGLATSSLFAMLDTPDVWASRLGTTAAALVSQGLGRLMRGFPEADWSSTILVGPAIEGVGWYPRVDNTLSAAAPGLWVAGDSAGIFRGLVPALISGYVAAGAMLED